MKNIPQALLITAAITLSGCATSHKNPFDVARVSQGYLKNPEKIYNSNAPHVANIVIDATSRHIPGTIPSGVGIGIYSIKILTSSTVNFQDLAQKTNHLEVWMPVSEAVDETGAKLKMSTFVRRQLSCPVCSPDA